MPPVHAVVFWVLSAAWNYHGVPQQKMGFVGDYETCSVLQEAFLAQPLPQGMANLTVKCAMSWSPFDNRT